jgi:hypothetical protein
MTDEQQPEDSIPIQATPTRPTDTSWIEFQRKEKQETIKRLEEAAKYLSGISSLSLSVVLGVNRDALKELSNDFELKGGICCWLLSIVLTLVVVFPFRYRYAENSADSIRAMHKKISHTKFLLLIVGALLYIAGISMMTYLYLFRQ